MTNKIKNIIALAAVTFVINVNAQTSNTVTKTTAPSLVSSKGSASSLGSFISVGYESQAIDRGQRVLSDAAYANVDVTAPLAYGIDGLVGVKYANASVHDDVLNLTGGVGTNLKIGDFGQYTSLTFTKRVNSPLEAYESDLNFRFDHLPIPYVNSLFTPIVTLSKTWDSSNKGVIAGVNRVDTFGIFGHKFCFNNTVQYGQFDTYHYAEIKSQLSTKIVGNVRGVVGVDYLTHFVPNQNFGTSVPYYAGVNVKF
jgi:hypothetical protein